MRITTRAAVPDDAAAIADVHVRAWQEGYRGIVNQAFLDEISVSERADRWAAILRGEMLVEGVARPTDFVAEIDGTIIGFAVAGEFRRDRDDVVAAASPGELWAMYVDPHHWGDGVGDVLMDLAVDHLITEGFDRAYLWVFADNIRAQRFYERHGWTDDGIVKDFELDEVAIAESRRSRPLP